MLTRNRRLMIALTEEQYERIKSLAEKTDMSMSAYMRSLLPRAGEDLAVGGSGETL